MVRASCANLPTVLHSLTPQITQRCGAGAVLLVHTGDVAFWQFSRWLLIMLVLQHVQLCPEVAESCIGGVLGVLIGAFKAAGSTVGLYAAPQIAQLCAAGWVVSIQASDGCWRTKCC